MVSEHRVLVVDYTMSLREIQYENALGERRHERVRALREVVIVLMDLENGQFHEQTIGFFESDCLLKDTGTYGGLRIVMLLL
jgi:hypothetical protein